MLLQILKLTVTQFRTEVARDYLSIYDGNNTNSRLLFAINGAYFLNAIYHITLDIYSTQAFFWLHFHSDGINHDTGFNLLYESRKGKQTFMLNF